jgi:hypothetical protein
VYVCQCADNMRLGASSTARRVTGQEMNCSRTLRTTFARKKIKTKDERQHFGSGQYASSVLQCDPKPGHWQIIKQQKTLL